MAHDFNLIQTQRYIYDKIFRREVTDGQPIYDLNTMADSNIESYNQNGRILSDIKDAMHSFPKYTLQQYENHFKRNFHSRWTRYFKDFELKTTDLPVDQSLAHDVYKKLWGTPKDRIKTMGVVTNFSTIPDYQGNLMTITKNMIKQYPNKTTNEYIKIIEKEYPTEAENLLNYLDKWKHVFNDNTYNNDVTVQNPWDQPRIRNKRHF